MEKRNDEKADNDDHDEVWEGVKMKLDKKALNTESENTWN